MSFMQSLAGVFGGQAAQSAPQQPNQQGQQANQQTTDTVNTSADQQASVSPLDSFKDLWQTDPSQKAEVNPLDTLFSVDPKAMQETVGKMNFLGQIPPKVQEALKAGGDDAVRANLFLMNQAAQQAYMQNAQTTAKIVEAALKKQAETFESQVSGIVKKNNFNSELTNANPVLAHPAAAPMIEGIKQQLLVKHPNASPQELAGMAQQYLISFADTLTGKSQKEAEKGTIPANQDFSDWM